MEDAPEEELQAKSERLPKHNRKRASRRAANGVGMKEDTLNDAHWPQAWPTWRMKTPEESVVSLQGVRLIKYTAELQTHSNPRTNTWKTPNCKLVFHINTCYNV
jgi:hypothetical protein